MSRTAISSQRIASAMELRKRLDHPGRPLSARERGRFPQQVDRGPATRTCSFTQHGSSQGGHRPRCSRTTEAARHFWNATTRRPESSRTRGLQWRPRGRGVAVDVIALNGLQFQVDLAEGLKTGLYLDQQAKLRLPRWGTREECRRGCSTASRLPRRLRPPRRRAGARQRARTRPKRRRCPAASGRYEVQWTLQNRRFGAAQRL